MNARVTRQPLVSVIVTTRNNHATLASCLRSIREQTYDNVEIVVVDNNSTDDTKDIAKRYTNHVYNKGPERSTQRNYAVEKASGKYVIIIDSDMELSPEVIAASVAKAESDPAVKGIIIPEESFGEGFWAQCKKLERSFYVGVDWIEAARFYDRAAYRQAGGYDENLVSGEDWDLSQRIGETGKLARVEPFIYHNEGRLKLAITLRKKYYYAQQFAKYIAANRGRQTQKQNIANQTGPLTRYKLFFAKPRHLFRNPFHGLGMLFMKTCEFGVGAVGYVTAKQKVS